MQKRWPNLITGPEVLSRPTYRGDLRVWTFFGGPCPTMMSGRHMRDIRRDPMCEHLSASTFRFYDVQVFPESHGRRWQKSVDPKAEKRAHLESSITIYPVWDEVSAELATREVEFDLGFAWDVMNQKLIIVWWHDDLLVDRQLPPKYMNLKNSMKNGAQVAHALGFAEAVKEERRAAAEYVMAFTS